MSLMYGLSSAMYGLSSVKYGMSSAMYGNMSAKYDRLFSDDKTDSQLNARLTANFCRRSCTGRRRQKSVVGEKRTPDKIRRRSKGLRGP